MDDTMKLWHDARYYKLKYIIKFIKKYYLNEYIMSIICKIIFNHDFE